jgi:hypothetical protein
VPSAVQPPEFLYDEITGESAVSRTVNQTVRIQATQDPAAIRQNGEVISWVSMQKIGRVLDQATLLLDKGDFSGAATLVAETEAWLSGRNVPKEHDAWKALASLQANVQDSRVNDPNCGRRRPVAGMELKNHGCFFNMVLMNSAREKPWAADSC